MKCDALSTEARAAEKVAAVPAVALAVAVVEVGRTEISPAVTVAMTIGEMTIAAVDRVTGVRKGPDAALVDLTGGVRIPATRTTTADMRSWIPPVRTVRICGADDGRCVPGNRLPINDRHSAC